ncbi:hypothetical protein SOV_34070 [Sporomusa ovata DSM 2662]|uniref:Uncharacterized protein n=1 Tax=Sporomusa ovata TaxID=2378 RepID=A0A0U1L2J7_9FIRM|nr:hypothetical protein [Sporomusa ovata]EQB25342.1 hypothetical protein SOV_5c05100 [Sporomusa ovata DSM 2662]CQR73907.1 hypothetical protein SpAn4DRAFT_0369 [Sporomusa ovata]
MEGNASFTLNAMMAGFYCGYHDLTDFSQEEERELDEFQAVLFGPHMPFYREFEFFFTRYGFKRHKRLIRLLIKATGGGYRVRCYREWSNNRDIAYQDKEQVALYVGNKRCPGKVRRKMIIRARKIRGDYRLLSSKAMGKVNTHENYI